MSSNPIHERLLEVLDEKFELMRENAKLRAGVTLVALELDQMGHTDIAEALHKILIAATEGQT